MTEEEISSAKTQKFYDNVSSIAAGLNLGTQYNSNNIYLSVPTPVPYPSTNTRSSSDSSTSTAYRGTSGNRYQYDTSNGNDKLNYSMDTAAQQRDYYNNLYDTSNNVQQDRQNGQFGGGIYY